jgi:hypothetical protein
MNVEIDMKETTLYSRIIQLKQENSALTIINLLLEAISADVCREIDSSTNDPFVGKKRKQILQSLSKCQVGYSQRLKSALDAYNEVATYLFLREKGVQIQAISEERHNTPDFKVDLSGKSFFLEMKTIGAAGGESEIRRMSDNDDRQISNYVKAEEIGLEAQIDIEAQIKSGKRVAIAEVGFDLMYRSASSNPGSTVDLMRVI